MWDMFCLGSAEIGVEFEAAIVGGGGTGVDIIGLGGAGGLIRFVGGPGIGVIVLCFSGSLMEGLVNMTGV